MVRDGDRRVIIEDGFTVKLSRKNVTYVAQTVQGNRPPRRKGNSPEVAVLKTRSRNENDPVGSVLVHGGRQTLESRVASSAPNNSALKVDGQRLCGRNLFV